MTVREPSSTTLYFGPWYRKSPFFEATIRHGCTAYEAFVDGSVPTKVNVLPIYDPKKRRPRR